jgi:Holliday junction resolvasome RuvABC DNA-binding subunit
MKVLGYDAKPAKAAVLQAQANLEAGVDTSTILREALKLMQ